jgi:hypothetical protein
MLAFLLDPEEGNYVGPKRRLTFTGLHVVTSQKINLFIVNVVRTSNLTYV